MRYLSLGMPTPELSPGEQETPASLLENKHLANNNTKIQCSDLKVL